MFFFYAKCHVVSYCTTERHKLTHYTFFDIDQVVVLDGLLYVSGNTQSTNMLTIQKYNPIIRGSDTPLSLNIEEGDNIYVYYSQLPPVIHRR